MNSTLLWNFSIPRSSHQKSTLNDIAARHPAFLDLSNASASRDFHSRTKNQM